jgi:lysozyme
VPAPKDVAERAVAAAEKAGGKAAAEPKQTTKPKQAAKAAARPATRKPSSPRPSSLSPSSLSPAGAAFIARFEGFRAKLYDDAAGHCTIGYGHLVHMGPTNGTEPPEFTQGITRAQALALLGADAAKAGDEVKRSVKVPLTQHQFDALVCFAFNVGNGAFRESTLLKQLNAGDYTAVPEQLNRWTKAGGRELAGLVRRRDEEGQLFTRGTYSLSG